MIITPEIQQQLGLTDAQVKELNKFLAFINVKSVSELLTVMNPANGFIPFEDADGDLKKIPINIFFQLIGGLAKPLAPDAPAPTVAGWYKPTTYSEDPGTNYPNAGNLKAVQGFDTLFYFDGTAWLAVKNEIDAKRKFVTAAEYEALENAGNVENDTVYFVEGDADGKAEKALKFFIEQESGGTLVKKAELNPNPYPPTLYGSTVEAGLLRANNTVNNINQPGITFRIARNMDLKAAGIIKVKMKIKPYGNDQAANANLIGIKGGVPTPLIVFSGTPDDNLITYDIDISEYDTVSIGTYVQDNVASTQIQLIEFFSLEGAVQLEDSVFKYINENSGGNNGDNFIDLIKFGCKGDGKYVVENGQKVLQGTDDTIKLQEALNLIVSKGGGTLYGGAHTFIVSKLTVPPTLNWVKVEFLGAAIPLARYGTVGVNDIKRPTGSMMIVSNLQTEQTGVVDCGSGPAGAYDNFNYVALVMRNCTVRTYDNPKCFAINAINALSIYLENVTVDTGVYNVQSTFPSYISVGILTPRRGNAAFNYLRNVSVSGYWTGIQCEEHTDGDQIILSSCVHGLKMRTGDHAMYFKRICAQRNQHHITVDGPCYFTVEQLNCEYVGTGQWDSQSGWQKSVSEINDPYSLGVGSVTWSNVRGAIGNVPYFTLNGASNLIVKRIGSEVRMTGNGNPDPNPIP